MSTLRVTNLKNETSASNNIVLDSSARALVGTSSAPTGTESQYALLNVKGTATGGSAGAYVALTRAENSAAITDGELLGRIIFGDQQAGEYAHINCLADGTAGSGDYPGRIVLATTADGASSPTEQMRLDSSGNLKFNSGYGSVATAYGCRAWVNFNGTGTVAIRASGNVSSITDNNTGDYTVNFTTAMPDANYSVTQSCLQNTSAGADNGPTFAPNTYATGSVRGITAYTDNAVDSVYVNVAIFR